MDKRSTIHYIRDGKGLQGESSFSDDEVVKMYQQYKSDFIHFGSRYSIDKEDLVDIFQDAIIAYCEQKEKGKLNDLRCSEKSYLFSIGKYKMIDLLRKMKRKVQKDEFYSEEIVEPAALSKLILNDQQKALSLALRSLGEKCQKIIDLFYYHDKSIAEITLSLSYKSDNVTKAHKSRCMKKLKDLSIHLLNR